MEGYHPTLDSGAIKPIVARTFPLVQAADALKYLLRDAPPGRWSSQCNYFRVLLTYSTKSCMSQ
jgi:hypothetical protein